MITRRSFILGSCAIFIGAEFWGAWTPVFAAESTSDDFIRELIRIEKANGGRLGVAVLDVKSKTIVGHRINERFPMCSTFKMLAVAALLAQVDAGREHLSRRIRFSKTDLVGYSPATTNHVDGDGMSLSELCEAAITFSDNTAANLLLKCIGGPSGVTQYARSLGDKVTRLDRIEPDLNHVLPGDPRDTTTPAAMLGNLNALVLGQALSPDSREQLITWLKGNKTGSTRLRAGLSKDWQIGDKTGTSNNTANDIAVIWPPKGPPLIVTAYLTDTKASPDQCNEALAAVGRALVAILWK